MTAFASIPTVAGITAVAGRVADPDPDSTGSVDPDPNSESGPASRRAKMNHKSRNFFFKFMF